MNNVNENQFTLPINSGDRPMFNTLPILEYIYEEISNQNNPYRKYNKEFVFSIVRDLIIFNEIFLEDRTNLDFKTFQELYLIMPKNLVVDWEENHIWKNTSVHPYHLFQYEDLFNDSRKSDLYVIDTNVKDEIFKTWFKEAPKDIISSLLEYSAIQWLRWISLSKEPSFLENNLYKVSQELSLTEHTYQQWTYLSILFQKESSVMDTYLSMNGRNSIYKLCELLDEKLFSSNLLKNALAPDSELVKMYFFNEPPKEYKGWKEYFFGIKNTITNQFEKSFVDDKNIINNIVKIVDNKKLLPLSNWSYIKELNIIKPLLLNSNSTVLIYGRQSLGKSSLAMSIINDLKLTPYKLNTDLLKEFDSTNDYNLLLLTASKLIEKLNGVFLIDQEDFKFNSPIIFADNCKKIIVQDTSNEISKDVVKNVSFALEILPLTLSQRTDFASQFFKDKDLSLKVAQRLKKQTDIIKVANICEKTKDYSWNTIILSINNLLSLQTKESYGFELDKWDTQDNVAPIAGYPQLTTELNRLVDFHQNPTKYEKIGAKLNKGLILVGPPGTGKTHFVKNLSSKINIPVYSVETTRLANHLDLINQTFSFLRKHSPCILFLDEIDVLINSPKTLTGVDLEKQKIINTFLTNVDGLENNEGIFIIGTTHRSNGFDEAATRTGRLSKIIKIDHPFEEAREEIWRVHLENKNCENINFKELAEITISFTCSDIMEASNTAANIAINRGLDKITMDILREACDIIYWGETGASVIKKENFIKTCFHEAGHALLSFVSQKKVRRITVSPRSGYLGATSILKSEGDFSSDRNTFNSNINVLLGGIAAEEVIYGSYEQGGSGDLRQAKYFFEEAYIKSGFSEFGPIRLEEDKSLWSNELRLKFEAIESNFMKERYAETKSFLQLNIDLLKNLAETLFHKKEISGSELQYFEQSIITIDNKPLPKVEDLIFISFDGNKNNNNSKSEAIFNTSNSAKNVVKDENSNNSDKED